MAQAGHPPVETNLPSGTTPLMNQVKIASTGVAVQLPANILLNGVVLQAKSTNSNPISVGLSNVNNTQDGTGNGFILEAGNSVPVELTNTNQLYVNGTAGDVVSFIGS